MTAERTSDLLSAARDIARVLQSRGIQGGDATKAFQRALRDRLFRERWTQAWCRTADAMGGRIGLTSTIDTLNQVATLLGIGKDWNSIGALASDAISCLISAGAFNTFVDWIPGANEADEAARPARSAPRRRAKAA
jgi:hypothetical protein